MYQLIARQLCSVREGLRPGRWTLRRWLEPECFEVENWSCEGPFSDVCNCRDNRCQRACERTIDCLEPVCEQPILRPDECVFLCEEQPQSFPPDFILGATCESVQAAYCPNLFQVCGGCPQPDPNDFNVGAACERSADCVSGNLIAYCIPANVPETGEETGWVDGYCIGLECQPGDCGPSARCVALTADQQTGCLARCGDNQAPCRAAINARRSTRTTRTAACAFHFELSGTTELD